MIFFSPKIELKVFETLLIFLSDWGGRLSIDDKMSQQWFYQKRPLWEICGELVGYWKSPPPHPSALPIWKISKKCAFFVVNVSNTFSEFAEFIEIKERSVAIANTWSYSVQPPNLPQISTKLTPAWQRVCMAFWWWWIKLFNHFANLAVIGRPSKFCQEIRIPHVLRHRGKSEQALPTTSPSPSPTTTTTSPPAPPPCASPHVPAPNSFSSHQAKVPCNTIFSDPSEIPKWWMDANWFCSFLSSKLQGLEKVLDKTCGRWGLDELKGSHLCAGDLGG